MSSLSRLVTILNDTQFYKISDDSIIKSELATYSFVIDKIYSKLDQLISDIFFENISTYAEYMYDHLFQIGNPDISLQQRLDIYSKRISISKFYYNCDHIKNAISSGGLSVEFSESPETGILTVTVLDDIGIYENDIDRENFIKIFIPAYCNVKFIHKI